ncbi:MAG: cell division FtsA domain-containing protein, partial [Acidobacteriota bacterium]
LVHDGGVEGTKMFGIGGRSFTGAIAQNMGISYEEAEKLKLGLSRGSLKDNEHHRVEEALLPTVKVWLSGVELGLSEFENIDQLPSKILLCGGGTGLPHLKRALETTNWRKDLPFTRDITIAHITPDQVDAVTDKTGKADDYTFITPMGLLNVGLDAVYNGTVNQSLLAKFNRALQV